MDKMVRKMGAYLRCKISGDRDFPKEQGALKDRVRPKV